MTDLLSYWRYNKTQRCINNSVYLNFKLLLHTVVICNILNKRLPKDICIRKNALNRKTRVADPNPQSGSAFDFGTWIRIQFKKFRGSQWRARDVHNGGLEAQNGALEGLYCRPVVADSHHLVKEQDPDPNLGEMLDPDPR